jgi:hypothetical protein
MAIGWHAFFDRIALLTFAVHGARKPHPFPGLIPTSIEDSACSMK